MKVKVKAFHSSKGILNYIPSINRNMAYVGNNTAWHAKT